MSKRVTLSNEDIALLLRLLKGIRLTLPYTDIEFVAAQRRQQLLDKLSTGTTVRSSDIETSRESQKEKTNG